ncbi:hypothetical protein E2C01_088456 [Portunus trituberculatus]|uniref:Uncharacterized protein n=1 Tax=Portunus trituberculatus TaxID=210409 RepID=A0A5B7JAT9_PORTR|nr:hypothetical protein [Portunus trituberculatus]
MKITTRATLQDLTSTLSLTDKPPPLRDLDPSTKQYWKRLRVLAMKENNKRMKLRKF